ncbi:uncharacterized protein [Typha latifolia]|uniref:uncharacterized protein isoform X1 n=1 Tax=Typha latifolia TaxID=4733 RepID=UPI003C2EE653
MDGMDGAGDDRTFRANFTTEGVAKLRERVKEKLKEFMGDYTDDTLVEYVVVLLRNGRRKDEARKELNVFLGDDSIAFVSWLWDYLSSNLHLYVQQQVPTPNDVAKSSQTAKELSVRNKSSPEHLTGSMQTGPEYEKESSKISRTRQKREWKGLVQEETESFPLRSVLTGILHGEGKTGQKSNNIARRSRSPNLHVHRKRGREDERQTTKQGESTSHSAIVASRRLLQFAVRDAVKTVQQLSSTSEPASKRLRSVVSTSMTDSVQDKKVQRVRSVVRAPGAIAALKAAAEAAEDVTKVRSSGSVFDRLSQGRGAMEFVSQSADLREQELQNEEYEDIDQVTAPINEDSHQISEYDRETAGDITMLEKETEMTANSASDNDGYDSVDIVRHHGVNASQSALSPCKDKNLLMADYSVAQESDVMRKPRLIDQGPPASSAPRTSSKIVNISVNVNTWKPPNYEARRDASGVESEISLNNGGSNTGKPNVRNQNENSASITNNLKGFGSADLERESQKTSTVPAAASYTAGHPLDDVDSRTLFVSNVHFAATKDTLSRHFNKFGAVLKVIIVTDAATGQPTGSAYVEFLHKESAELALSLNGTSFMSRILKVVRRSSHEAAQMLGWSRIARVSPFASRLGRIPYPRRVLPSAFRGRLPIKAGARSLQWKREVLTVQPTEATKCAPNAALTSGSQVLSPTARSLTYNRTEPKADSSSGLV